MLKNLKTRKTIEEIFEYNLLTYKRTETKLIENINNFDSEFDVFDVNLTHLSIDWELLGKENKQYFIIVDSSIGNLFLTKSTKEIQKYYTIKILNYNECEDLYQYQYLRGEKLDKILQINKV